MVTSRRIETIVLEIELILKQIFAMEIELSLKCSWMIDFGIYLAIILFQFSILCMIFDFVSIDNVLMLRIVNMCNVALQYYVYIYVYSDNKA